MKRSRKVKRHTRKYRKLKIAKRARRNQKPRRETNLTARQYFSRSTEFQETWDDVVHAISRMRSKGMSLSRASEEIGIDPNVVIRLGRTALRKQPNGTYVPKKTDRLLRVLTVLTADGRQEIATRDSRQASQLGRYWDAVQRYLQMGDTSRLEKFQGKKITDASREQFLLLTDTEELNRLGKAGVLSFESLYARHG